MRSKLVLVRQSADERYSKWINENSFIGQEFAWQTGGVSFSINKADMKNDCLHQKQHHRTIAFKEEYMDF